ncbi:MAG: hypothetical protein JSW01_06075 [Candidatus Bathyarchaeota archaeon]|nr:MAG: hypothetical protein JSW01_06075 [Candidatus Bathyarchaeota archaeon]
MAEAIRIGPIKVGQIGGDKCGCGSSTIRVYVTPMPRPVCKKCWSKLANTDTEW